MLETRILGEDGLAKRRLRRRRAQASTCSCLLLYRQRKKCIQGAEPVGTSFERSIRKRFERGRRMKGGFGDSLLPAQTRDGCKCEQGLSRLLGCDNPDDVENQVDCGPAERAAEKKLDVDR